MKFRKYLAAQAKAKSAATGKLIWNIFSKLPAELILNITEYLSPGSIGCVSLCCRTTYNAIGSLYVKSLVLYDKYEFLALLERDLPQYIACYHCDSLHSIKKARRYDWSKYKNRYTKDHREKPCFGPEDSNMAYVQPSFSFVLFQMAMKLYQQEKDHRTILEMLSSKTKTYCILRDTAKQRCWRARIVAGSLVLRDQTIILCPSEIPQKYIIEVLQDTLSTVEICISSL